MSGYSRSALAYFDAHAINPVIAWRLGVRERDGQLLYPYCAPDGMLFYRRRPLDDNVTYQPRGVPPRMWWPVGHGREVLVCEGEADALAVLSAAPDMTVAAIPGASFPPHRAADELAGCDRVWVAFDGDAAGRRAALGYDRSGEHVPGIAEVVGARVIAVPDGLDLADLFYALGKPARRLAWLARAMREAQPVPRRPAKRPQAGPRRVKVDTDLERIPPPVYVEALGGEPVERGWVRCPLPDHDDRNPSCQVWDEPERGWYCHSCRRGGSIYDLAAGVWGLSTRGDDFREVKRRLGELFR